MSTTTMSAAMPIASANTLHSAEQMEATTKAIDAALGRVIRRSRSAINLSLEALGSLCGVTYQQIQKYETGKNRVSASTLFLIAAAVGRTPADMLAEVAAETDTAPGGPAPSVPVLRLSMRLMALPEETRRPVVASCTAVVSAVEDARRLVSGGAL